MFTKTAEFNNTMCCRMLISRACCMAEAFDRFRVRLLKG